MCVLSHLWFCMSRCVGLVQACCRSMVAWIGCQLEASVYRCLSDWEPYLGSHIPWVFCGLLSMVSCLCLHLFIAIASRSFCVVCFRVSSLINRRKYSHHAAPWSPPFNERDSGIYFVCTTQSCFVVSLLFFVFAKFHFIINMWNSTSAAPWSVSSHVCDKYPSYLIY